MLLAAPVETGCKLGLASGIDPAMLKPMSERSMAARQMLHERQNICVQNFGRLIIGSAFPVNHVQSRPLLRGHIRDKFRQVDVGQYLYLRLRACEETPFRRAALTKIWRLRQFRRPETMHASQGLEVEFMFLMRLEGAVGETAA